MADHAHTLDAQQNRPAIGVRVELLVQPVEFRPEHPGRLGGLLPGRHGGKQRGHQSLQAPLQGLQRHVAGEPVGDDHVGRVGE